ncbi:MAG: GxxExxY protein [Anaerolineales bacterium]
MPDLVTDATGNDLTYRIIGAAMTVHNFIGPGYKEEIYERALEVELKDQGIGVQRQYPVEVHYEDVQVGQFYLDLFVESTVVVELKAFAHQLTNDERAQVINYLKATQAPVGLLFNFGRRRLEWKRVFPAQDDGAVQRIGRDDVYKSHRRDGEPPIYIPKSKRQ